MRVLTVVGNRPQFVKSAPLSLALRNAGIAEAVLHTGQHWDRELSAVFFEELALPQPAYRLDLRTADTTRMRAGVLAALRAERPDTVIVLGDTNSTLAGALAASDARVPVAHVEAGLRSGDLEMPEERNRIAVDRLATLLFPPAKDSAATLRVEAVTGEIAVVGDVMADAARIFGPLARERSRVLERLGVDPGAYVLATVHREANVRPERLRRIAAGLSASARPVVFPAHPHTRAVLERQAIPLGRLVRLTEPLGYLDLAALAGHAAAIATDSGGLQKEAYWYGVPCVTLRPSTEWTATVEAGANILVDADPDRIATALDAARMPSGRPVLYGDGHASERIASALVDTIGRRAS